MQKKSRIIFLIPVLFLIITFVINCLRTPFWDETHSFEISRLSFFQIFTLTRIEGHFILWYLILKPFSSLKLYPYSMFLINWLFAIGAVFVLWKKAPFNNFIKTTITFSTPFLLYFAVVSRCYSIGIFFLFLICASFKDRFKKPKMFSTLLLICSNTSLMTFIPCFYLWIMFLYQLFKRKSKNFKTSFLFFLLNGVLFLIQFLNLRKPYVTSFDHSNFVKKLINFIIFPYSDDFFARLFHIAVFILFYYGIFYLFKKSKYALYFVLSSYLTLTFIFYYFYNGSFWNYYFYYVYFIVLFWIFKRQLFLNKYIKILFLVILVLMMFPNVIHEDGKMEKIYESKSREIANFVSSKEELKNSKLYCLDWWSDVSPASDIYLKQKGIDIYDVFSFKTTSFESIKNTFFYKTLVFDMDKFYNSLDKTKRNYLLTDGTFFIAQKAKNDEKYYLKPIIIEKSLNLGVFELVKK